MRSYLDFEKPVAEIEANVEELRALGVEPKNGPEGLVDFPAMMEGRPVYLCWKLGEPEVLHWHDLDAGFRGRQPLTGHDDLHVLSHAAEDKAACAAGVHRGRTRPPCESIDGARRVSSGRSGVDEFADVLMDLPLGWIERC